MVESHSRPLLTPTLTATLTLNPDCNPNPQMHLPAVSYPQAFLHTQSLRVMIAGSGHPVVPANVPSPSLALTLCLPKESLLCRPNRAPNPAIMEEH